MQNFYGEKSFFFKLSVLAHLTLNKSVGELSQNLSVNCLKNRVGDLSCR